MEKRTILMSVPITFILLAAADPQPETQLRTLTPVLAVIFTRYLSNRLPRPVHSSTMLVGLFLVWLAATSLFGHVTVPAVAAILSGSATFFLLRASNPSADPAVLTYLSSVHPASLFTCAAVETFSPHPHVTFHLLVLTSLLLHRFAVRPAATIMWTMASQKLTPPNLLVPTVAETKADKTLACR